MPNFTNAEERIIQELASGDLEGDPPQGYDDLPDTRKAAVIVEAAVRVKRLAETMDEATK